MEEPVCCDDVSPEFVAHMSALNQIICSQSTGIAISAKICINMEGLYADYCEINTIWYNTVNDLVRGMTSGKKTDNVSVSVGVSGGDGDDDHEKKAVSDNNDADNGNDDSFTNDCDGSTSIGINEAVTGPTDSEQ